jgi:hypothetical protein
VAKIPVPEPLIQVGLFIDGLDDGRYACDGTLTKVTVTLLYVFGDYLYLSVKDIIICFPPMIHADHNLTKLKQSQ